jgi:F-type H+-transporting ATPase subunit delta
MNQSKISVRYAKAIFILAKEKNILLAVYTDFKLIRENIIKFVEFKNVITSPIIKPSEKKTLLTKVFEASINEITMNFLRMLVDNNRESYILDIARNFETMYRVEFKIKEVVLTTTVELDQTIKDNITKIVEETYKSKVEIKEKIDEDMIGGIIVRIGHEQLDLSVATQLQEIKKALKSEAFIKKI